MKFLVFDDRNALDCAAAESIAALLKEKPNAILGLATGSSPEGMYRQLCRMHREEGLDFSAVRSFNLDEYIGIPEDHPQSYHVFMEENLFSKVNIQKENTHIPGSAYDSGEAYDNEIAAAGGIDLQVLGIGRNGHIGFNEPAQSLALGTHVAALTPSTREANARFFDSIEQVPEYAMTMGIGSIMGAKKILLIATGKEKHEAVQFLRDALVSTRVPATLLKLHPDVTVFCDREAYGQ